MNYRITLFSGEKINCRIDGTLFAALMYANRTYGTANVKGIEVLTEEEIEEYWNSQIDVESHLQP